VAHACNPSYSGDRDQEDCSLKLAWANSLRDPRLKKPITKKGWQSGSRCRPWVQTPVPKKKKKEKQKEIMSRIFSVGLGKPNPHLLAIKTKYHTQNPKRWKQDLKGSV
jgi:hypothetical protein